MLQGNLNDSLLVDSGLTTKGESWYFTVEPSDGTTFGNLQISETVAIENSAPNATDLQITPGTPVTADTLTANYTFVDNDTDTEIGTLIIWYKNGVLQGGLNDSTEVSASYTTKNDEWHFKIRPSDGTDYGLWISCPTNVTIGNTGPSVSNANINPASPKTGDDLTATYDFADPDSDAESGSEISWYKDGVLEGALNDSFTIQAGNTSKTEEWHYKMRPKDGTTFGLWVGSTNVTITNTVPTASTLDISPSNPATHQNLTASYLFSDADGDGDSGSKIRWYRNGMLQGNLNDSLLVNSSLTTKGESWYFTVEPNDGTSFGSLQQASAVTIENSAPDATNLQITPESPVTADTLTANYTFVDNDTDTEIGTLIIWYKNGVLQGGLNNSKSVSASYTTKTEIWHFKVRPFDGTDYGLWISCPTNITIGNSPPTATTLQITPINPITSNDLIASYNWADNDTGDLNSGTEICWYLNGVLQISLNDTLTVGAGNTSKAEEWHFKVHPYDGIDFGGWVSSSTNVSIGNTPPEVSNVQINETSPVPLGNDLHVLYSYTDYDFDGQNNNSREIRWYKTNGTGTYLMSELNESMDVNFGNTTTGDIWYFTIRVSDGTNLSSLGTSASVSIAVAANQLPSASNLNISILVFLIL
jgi:hypothetical protein